MSAARLYFLCLAFFSCSAFSSLQNWKDERDDKQRPQDLGNRARHWVKVMTGVPAGWEVGEKGVWSGVGGVGWGGVGVCEWAGCHVLPFRLYPWSHTEEELGLEGGGGGQTERQTERETEGDRQKDRQREGDKQTERNRLRDRDKEAERQRQTKTATETGRKTYRKRHDYTTVNEMAERDRENWGGVVSWGAEWKSCGWSNWLSSAYSPSY